jgi:hypothetical protein
MWLVEITPLEDSPATQENRWLFTDIDAATNLVAALESLIGPSVALIECKEVSLQSTAPPVAMVYSCYVPSVADLMEFAAQTQSAQTPHPLSRYGLQGTAYAPVVRSATPKLLVGDLAMQVKNQVAKGDTTWKERTPDGVYYTGVDPTQIYDTAKAAYNANLIAAQKRLGTPAYTRLTNMLTALDSAPDFFNTPQVS